MFFKNATIYRLPPKWPAAMSAGSLCAQLERGLFHTCPSNQPSSRGWVPPRKGDGLIYQQDYQLMICLKVQEKLLPSAVVNEAVQERAEAIGDQQGYPPGRKQLKEIKERVVEELLAKAFTVSRRTFAWIDPVAGWLVVDTASQARAEEVVEHLRHCLDEFPLALPHTQLSPQSAMASWLADGEAPDGFTIDRDCELKSLAEEKAAVKFVRHPLQDEWADEVKTHLAAGKLPTHLALTWDERISFVLGDSMEVKRLTFLDLVKEAAEENAKHADEQFDADFAIMTGELRRFIDALMAALGGEQVEEAAAQ